MFLLNQPLILLKGFIFLYKTFSCIHIGTHRLKLLFRISAKAGHLLFKHKHTLNICLVDASLRYVKTNSASHIVCMDEFLANNSSVSTYVSRIISSKLIQLRSLIKFEPCTLSNQY